MDDRRAERMRLFDSTPMHRADIEVHAGATPSTDEDLASFLRFSSVQLRSLAPHRPLRARFAVFPLLSIVHASSSAAELEWPRDERSADRDRALVIVTVAGALEVETVGPVMRRQEVTVVCPYEAPLIARLTGDDNDVVYASIDPRLLGAITLPTASRTITRPLDRSALAPSLMFLAGLCGIATSGSSAAGALRSTAEDVVRALLVQALGDAAEPLTLFARAMELIVADYADPRLTVGVIAARLGVPMRTLQAAFTASGTTAATQLRDVRARAALRLHRGNGFLTYAAISRAVGFGSESALYRALREVDLDERQH
ncbi:MAG: helix-turn-helix transcriptional regulator [Microbacterium sp.]|nr:helix-turn-helix transcriptional regulator [Microbacterium sp.]